ncbi:hypothetical protein [Massilia sp. LjRoot122]|uniref:hypothetical protein n=1 Tax=Massilia sp. LjRoot122 TaxID=3342257 RepID=UPI003ED10057
MSLARVVFGWHAINAVFGVIQCFADQHFFSAERPILASLQIAAIDGVAPSELALLYFAHRDVNPAPFIHLVVSHHYHANYQKATLARRTKQEVPRSETRLPERIFDSLR